MNVQGGVGQAWSNWEASEQRWDTSGGGDEGMGYGQREPATVKRAPDAVPGRRAQCAGARTHKDGSRMIDRMATCAVVLAAALCLPALLLNGTLGCSDASTRGGRNAGKGRTGSGIEREGSPSAGLRVPPPNALPLQIRLELEGLTRNSRSDITALDTRGALGGERVNLREYYLPDCPPVEMQFLRSEYLRSLMALLTAGNKPKDDITQKEARVVLVRAANQPKADSLWALLMARVPLANQGRCKAGPGDSGYCEFTTAQRAVCLWRTGLWLVYMDVATGLAQEGSGQANELRENIRGQIEAQFEELAGM